VARFCPGIPNPGIERRDGKGFAVAVDDFVGVGSAERLEDGTADVLRGRDQREGGVLRPDSCTRRTMISSFLFCKPSLARTALGPNRSGSMPGRTRFSHTWNRSDAARPRYRRSCPRQQPDARLPDLRPRPRPALVPRQPALVAVRLAPGGQRNHPVMESLAALAERVLLALVRAGDEPVQRDRDVTSELAHRSS